MKHKKLLILLTIALFVSVGIFLIYQFTYKKEFNYVALGDSLAAGRNPYGVDDYGYTDYISDYLKKEYKLRSYINYGVSGYKTSDLIDDINYNRKIEVNGKTENIRKSLRESDIVTISIGANDFMSGASISSISNMLSDEDYVIKMVDDTMDKIDELLALIKKYAKNTIIVVGYYNPLPMLTKYKDQIDEVIHYADKKYQQLCDQYGILYVKVSDVIAMDSNYLPNPLDIHPSKSGYEVISNKVIEVINRELLK